MITVGIDAATCTGIAVVGEGQDRGKTIQVPDIKGFLRLQLIADEVFKTIQIWRPEFVAIEGFAYVRNISSFVTLVQVGTVIRVALRQAGIPWVEVPPPVLKKWTCGTGNADKEMMAKAAKERWDFTSHSHDIIDAYCLAQLAQLGWGQILAMKGISVGWEKS
jgi:crossover junction endodeoxyribonuclease RuvC